MKQEEIDGVRKASKTPDGWGTGTKYNKGEPKWVCLFHGVKTKEDGQILADSLNRIMDRLARPKILLVEQCFVTEEAGRPELAIPSALVEEGFAMAAFAALGREASNPISKTLS